jgi:hypothetical protein
MRRTTNALTRAASSQRFVRLTTSGATFAPIVELAGGSAAVVRWTVEETREVFTGVSPSINFGSAANRHVRLSVVGGRGLADITTLNLGFLSTQDSGSYNLGSGYDHVSQGVTAVESLTFMTGLRRFLAAQTTGTTASPLAGTVDVTGLSSLEHLECYNARIQSVNLTGCTSLMRLCVESNNLSILDLNPVAGSLYDLRAAGQQGGSLEFVPLDVDLAHIYHFCVTYQTVIGLPPLLRMPVLEELLVFNTGQSGALTPTSAALSSLAAENNAYTSLNVSGLFQSDWSSLSLHNNALTAVDLTDCHGLFNIDLSNNNLSQAVVDSVLTEVDSWGTSSHTLNLSSNAAPSGTGQFHLAALSSRGWTTTV